MASFRGTRRHDLITPEEVSPGVETQPGFPAPSGGADTVVGDRGDDTIAAGGGNDTVAGGLGADSIDLGAGDDYALWKTGDGNDAIEGGDGFDVLAIDAGTRPEYISIYDGFLGASYFSDRRIEGLDSSGIERFELRAGGGDYVQISDLSGTALEEIRIDFAPGGRDGVGFVGTGAAERLALANGPGGLLLVQGLGVTTEIAGFEAKRDEFIISLGEGADTVEATGFSGANLNVATGAGDDLGFLGAGDDRWGAVGTPGNDTVWGGDGRDTLDLDASLAADVIVIAGDGGFATATHAGSTIELHDFERVEVESAGGNDRIDAAGITGVLRLFAFGGAGADTILGGAKADELTGGAGNDLLTGGGGNDRFILGTEAADGVTTLDTVTDFALGRDVLDLRAWGGGYDAEATAEGLLITLQGGDLDQVLLRGVQSLAGVDILI